MTGTTVAGDGRDALSHQRPNGLSPGQSPKEFLLTLEFCLSLLVNRSLTVSFHTSMKHEANIILKIYLLLICHSNLTGHSVLCLLNLATLFKG